MARSETPEMTVVLTTIPGYESIRKTIRHLKNQTVRDRLEIIIISPSMEKSAAMESDLKDFHNTIFIEADIDNELYDAWEEAVHRSSAPVIAFGENHAFPVPGWAEALIEAHKGPWAGVGSVITNANPGSLNSWAQMYMTYGRWTDPIEAGEVEDIPGHNSSYKRSILLEYGEQLKYMLIRTNTMNMDLRSRGYRLYMEPGARVLHINVSRSTSILVDLFYNGAIYTAALAFNKKWSLPRRVFNACLEPLIMLKYFRGTLHHIRRSGNWSKLMPDTLPIIVSGLTAHFFGKLLGYFTGFRKTQIRINSYEFDRFKYITAQDIEYLTDPGNSGTRQES